MRKHLYLITEHENDDLVGTCKVADERLTRPTKNEEGPIQKFDQDNREFYSVGRLVGMGYADFEDEDDYETRAGEVIQQKLDDLDDDHLEKAGLDPQEVGA